MGGTRIRRVAKRICTEVAGIVGARQRHDAVLETYRACETMYAGARGGPMRAGGVHRLRA